MKILPIGHLVKANPIQTQFLQKPKMNVNLYVTKDYKMKPPSGLEKTNPIKANFRKAKMNVKSLAKKSGHTRSAEITKNGCIPISKKYNALNMKV